MSLSTYDPIKNCFVLKPMTTPDQINAFHPDYMKTHEPDFMKSFRTVEANRQAAETLSNYVTKKRKTNPLHGFVHGIAKAKPPVADMLKPREFKVFSAAGTANVTPKYKKTHSQIMSAVVAKKRVTNKNWGTALPDSPNIPKIKPEEV